MKNQQSGFTLIELIAVIVVLGILAATAVPRFVNLTTAASEASVQGVAGNLASASALNHANNIADDAGLTADGTPVNVQTCGDVANVLDGGLPTDYTITNPTGTGTTIEGGGVGSQGGSSTCQVGYDRDGDGTNDATANFTAYGVQ